MERILHDNSSSSLNKIKIANEILSNRRNPLLNGIIFGYYLGLFDYESQFKLTKSVEVLSQSFKKLLTEGLSELDLLSRTISLFSEHFLISQNSVKNNNNNDFFLLESRKNKLSNDSIFARELMEEQIKEEEERKLRQAAINEENNKLNIKKCSICLEEMSMLDQETFFLDHSDCIVHTECFKNFLFSQINENKLPIKCPVCNKEEVFEYLIRDVLKKENKQDLIKKYDTYQMNNFLRNNQDTYSCCPSPGCTYLFNTEGVKLDYFKCPICKKEYCLACKSDAHKGMSCEEFRKTRDVNYLDQEFEKFVAGQKFKQCPKCKFFVEKTQGCDHITCRCGYEFCYVCGAERKSYYGHQCVPH